MQPIRKLAKVLENLADPEHYFFSVSDFYQLFPDMTLEALRVLLGRAVKSELLARVCRGIYLYPKTGYRKGFELYHAAARLREDTFCYLSLESVLSEAGIISQIPLNWITLMTGGRSGVIPCGKWGHIEFIHTKKSPDLLGSLLVYDSRYRLLRAAVPLALQDMRAAKRSMDLIDWEAVNESI
ncbi:type IV toxin-antitoxin system AbiEi family antitoxin [Breznakiellaceae bacterium SP9]